jgi:hypothetical protein
MLCRLNAQTSVRLSGVTDPMSLAPRNSNGGEVYRARNSRRQDHPLVSLVTGDLECTPANKWPVNEPLLRSSIRLTRDRKTHYGR